MNKSNRTSRSSIEGHGVSRDGAVVSDAGRRWWVAVMLMGSWIVPAAARGVLAAVQMTEGTRVIQILVVAFGFWLPAAVALLFAAFPRRLPICFWASILNMILAVVGVILGFLLQVYY